MIGTRTSRFSSDCLVNAEATETIVASASSPSFRRRFQVGSL